MVKVVNNFLDKEEFNKIYNILSSDEFPWYFSEYITSPKDPKHYFYFIHHFYKNYYPSKWFYLFDNFLNKINCKSLLRIKGNLMIGEKQQRKNKPHKDYNFEHKGCLLYLNDNNGKSYFEDKQVLPKANRVVFFDPSKEHCSSVCTDKKRRMVINFNYF